MHVPVFGFWFSVLAKTKDPKPKTKFSQPNFQRRRSPNFYSTTCQQVSGQAGNSNIDRFF
jgi:hypothetical protein